MLLGKVSFHAAPIKMVVVTQNAATTATTKRSIDLSEPLATSQSL